MHYMQERKAALDASCCVPGNHSACTARAMLGMQRSAGLACRGVAAYVHCLLLVKAGMFSPRAEHAEASAIPECRR